MILSKVRFKNFFSSGNSFVEIDLLKYRRSVISGKNGEGKSTVLSAISFGAFGKPIKQVTKPLVVNTINNKNCLVELEGSNGGKDFLIRRGIKPAVFEIFEDGKLVDQTLVGDYQTYLEETIFKCSFRTFLQTSVISIENYKPFMSLTAADRRSFIEDILDIKVFSAMNQMVKADNTKNKEALRIVDAEFRTLKEKIQALKSHIEQVESIASEATANIDSDIERVESDIKTTLETLEAAKGTLVLTKEKTLAIADLQRSSNTLSTKIAELKSSIVKVKKEMAFFVDNDNCPVCSQPMVPANIDSVVSEHKSHIDTHAVELKRLVDELDKLGDVAKLQSDHNKVVSDINTKITAANVTVTHLNAQLVKLNKDKLKSSVSIDLTEQKQELKDMARNAIKIREQQSTLNIDQDYNTLMLELLKDSGIKSKIVDQYIPIINKLVNEYLERLDFFVSFNMDSEFNEVIKSRHRDTFTYNSFSAGERQRIDLALMFTMRRLASMKSSFSCNLLCADEVLDAAVDADGVALLNNILLSPEFDDTNLIVISHRSTDLFQDLFDGRYLAKKRDGFSEIHEINE